MLLLCIYSLPIVTCSQKVFFRLFDASIERNIMFELKYFNKIKRYYQFFFYETVIEQKIEFFFKVLY